MACRAYHDEIDSVKLEEQANFTKLSRLLTDKGTEALRNVLKQCIHPSLPVALASCRGILEKIRSRAISQRYWNALYPSNGELPDEKTFDITLLFILLRNICGLITPAAGWNFMPRLSDRSTEANIVRIKLYRDKCLGQMSSNRVDTKQFEQLWEAISQALIDLDISSFEIDFLKICPLDARVLTEIPELWEWRKVSVSHRPKFVKLHEYGKHNLQEIKEINDVRVCFSKEFLIKRGSDATSVFVGLSKDGAERAVKRLVRDDDICSALAEQEKKILNEPNAFKSNHVVKYRFLDKSNPDWLYLIMDLYEETLEEFVTHSNPIDLSKIARDIIRQILRGLADIHHDPRGILHRDLKPSNILRDVDGNWLLADFGISRILTPGKSTCHSKEKGTDHWRAVESCSSNSNEVRYKKESDVQVAGMIAFYVLTKGKHPFGEELDQRRNVFDGNPVYLKMVTNPAANDLISWMLSKEPKERPLAEEALKHPYLASPEQQFKMLCEVGNQPEIKKGDANSDVVQKVRAIPGDWQEQMCPKVLRYLCKDDVKGKTYRYGSCWCECLRLIRNVKEHWLERFCFGPQPEEFYFVENPQKYFLNLFPDLVTNIHKIVRSCDWKEKSELKEYFK